MDELTPDISKPALPSTLTTSEARSPERLEAIVAAFDVDHAKRYQRRDITGDGHAETFCNIFVSDVTTALGAEIPHQYLGRWQDVRGNAEWLRTGPRFWRACTAADAQASADKGCPAVVVWDAPNRSHGHIALLVPSRGLPGTWIAQAGASNFSRGPIASGFGNVTPLEFFHHP